MARVFTEGFEWNTLSSPAIPTGTVDNASSSGSVAMESSIVRSGAFSLKLTPASGAAGWWDPSISFGAADTVAATYTAYIDDVALNDTTGANQNTWPGEGKVVLLVPTADSAKGT